MMHDGEPSEAGIPLPIQPDPAASSNKILVVATLAALVLAGSAIVYRTRPYYYSSAKTSSTTPTASISVMDKGSTHKGKQRKVLVDLDQESNGDADEDADRDRNDSAANFDGESSTAREKEGKSVRSKDRRRRGKDPLKEMLKGKSKSGKAFEYSLLHSHPSSPSASSTFNHDTNYSSSSSKPNSGVKGNNHGGSRSSTKNVPSGSTSGPAMELAPTQLPEISQRQRQRNSRSPPPQSPYASHASPADVDPYHQDRELPQTTQICGPHRVAEEDSPSPSPSHSLPHASSSLHPYPSLASSQSASTRNSDADADADHIYTRAQSPDSDQARPRRVGSLAGESAGTSSRGDADGEELELDSGAETEATAAVSMSSSFVLSESGKHRREREAEEEGTPATSPACSERSVSTPRVDAQVAKKAGRRKGARPSSKQGAKLDQSQASDPWDWDGAGAGQGEVTSSVSSSSRKEKGAEWDEAYQPPSGSVAASTTYPSFSSVAGASSTALATSTSLDQPTNVAGSTAGMSTSATAPGTSNIGNANVPPLPMGEVGDFGDKDRENEKADEEQTFTFPTLNPVAGATATTGAGSSRTRSSQGDIYTISNTNNINTAHSFGSPSIGGRRAPTPRRPPTPSRNNSTASHSRNASNGSTPPPPLRPMTPGSNSTGLASPSIPPANGAMPALSTQTQLASLRGALEASRLREEKSKAEMERCAKEAETIKWENTNLGRINMELQMHIRSLTHQLQTYNALFATAPHLQQQYVNGPVGTPGAGSAAATVYPGSAGPSPSSLSPTSQDPSTTITNNTSNSTSAPQHSPQQAPSQSSPSHPLHLHLLQMNSMMSPTGMPSPSLGGGPMSPTYPIGPYPGAPSPFFPYSIPPHLHALPHPLTVSHAQQAHIQQQFHQSLSQAQAQAQPSSHQASLFSMIFPTGSPAASHQAYPAYGTPANVSGPTGTLFGSGSSSATGALSTGSLSPDLNGSPSQSSGETALKKKRSRTRTQTANGRMGGRAGWEDGSDGWIGGFTADDQGKEEEDADHDLPNSMHDDGDDEDQEIESDFNELLADAILKRPGSIRRVSSRRGKLNTEKDGRADSEDKDSASPLERSEEASEEQLTEFTFPSLSNLGNVYRSGGKATIGEYSSSSLSSSSTSPSLAVASVIPKDVSESPVLVDANEERPHPLPPLIEQAEDTEISAETQDAQPSTEELEAQEISEAPLSSPDSEATPRKEKLDSELTELAMGSIKEVDGWTISC